MPVKNHFFQSGSLKLNVYFCMEGKKLQLHHINNHPRVAACLSYLLQATFALLILLLVNRHLQKVLLAADEAHRASHPRALPDPFRTRSTRFPLLSSFSSRRRNYDFIPGKHSTGCCGPSGTMFQFVQNYLSMRVFKRFIAVFIYLFYFYQTKEARAGMVGTS